MKRTWMAATMLAGALLAGGCSTCCGGGPRAAAEEKGMMRHVVLFAWKAGTPAGTVTAIEQKFAALPAAIPQIAGFEWGTDVSPEKLAQGFTHCFFVTFKDAAARDAYLPHPAHKAFVEFAGPHIDKVLVVDYVAKP